jgi:hypothetical protein
LAGVTGGVAQFLVVRLITMFQALPKNRDGWYRVLLFPFQAYPFAAILFRLISGFIFSVDIRKFPNLSILMFYGCFACFIVLVCVSFILLIMKRPRWAFQAFIFGVVNIVAGFVCFPKDFPVA